MAKRDSELVGRISDYVSIGISRTDIYRSLVEEEGYGQLTSSVFDIWYDRALSLIRDKTAIDREYRLKRSIEIYESLYEGLMKKASSLFKSLSKMVDVKGNLKEGVKRMEWNGGRREITSCLENSIRALQDKEALIGVHSKEARIFWKDTIKKDQEFAEKYDVSKLSKEEKDRLLDIFNKMNSIPLSTLEKVDIPHEDKRYKVSSKDIPDSADRAVLESEEVTQTTLVK